MGHFGRLYIFVNKEIFNFHTKMTLYIEYEVTDIQRV
jgi:hypothetical protein